MMKAVQAGVRTPASFIALLRGVNVSGRNRVPMDPLRALCTELGWGEARTYIQSPARRT